MVTPFIAAKPSAAPVRNPRNRLVVIGSSAACILGAVIGFVLVQTGRHPAHAPPVAQSPPTPAQFQPIPGEYRPPDRARIASALTESRKVYASEGLSGLARASMSCFDRLARAPAYGLLDHCLALDAYGAQTYASAAGEGAPQSTWFGQGPVRRLAAAQGLLAGRTDPNSRLIDTNRLIDEVAMAQAPPPPMREQVKPAPATIEVHPSAAAPTGAAPQTAAVKPPAAPSARPAPPNRLAEAPPRTAPSPPVAPTPRLEAREAFQGPSFNCRYARSVTERMVCGEPELAAADRRLAREFDRAMARTPDPRGLRRQQDRWLAARERAGDDYDAVLRLYAIRTQELREED